MKRTLLDITQKISRKPQDTPLTPVNLTDPDYFIWEAKGWRFASILREIEYRTAQDRIRVIVNTQYISARDYIIEEKPDGLIFKFIRENFEFELEDDDYIEVTGDIEQYA
jgi:hypothetical protein